MLLPFTITRRTPLPATFRPTPLHPAHKLSLDLQIYVSRILHRLFSFLHRLFTVFILKNTKGRRGNPQGFRVARVYGGCYVKWGVRDVEARAMGYVRENTGVPVPKVWGFWSHRERGGSSSSSSSNSNSSSSNSASKSRLIASDEDVVRRRRKSGSGELNYMLIEALPGDPVGEVWAEMDDVAKDRFGREFVGYLRELRALEQPGVPLRGASEGDGGVRTGYVSAVDYQPLTDHRIATVPYGPFEDVDGWLECEYLLGYVAKARPRDVYERLEGGLKRRRDVVFTHSDLTPRNVLVEKESGRITGIVDWDSAGWCVGWWEGVKGVYGWNDGSFGRKVTTDEEDKGGLMETWRGLLREVVGDFEGELRADEEMRDIYGFPY